MPIGTGIIELERHPNLVVNKEYIPFLTDCGLLDFDRLYDFNGGNAVKRINERSVTRMEIPHKKRTHIFYLKRHVASRPSPWEMISSFLTGRSAAPGMAEFENICAFRQKGLSTVVPVAAGVQRTGFCCYKSFLITESFEPYISLEEMIRFHPYRLQGPEGESRKKKLLRTIACLARQMHEQGFNHRDFNATHVLIGPEDKDGNFPLSLFDLQRMDRRKWLKYKWFIKIMAELSYSMPEPLFTAEDRLLLYKTYKGISTTGFIDHFQLYWIRIKTRGIKRHTRNIIERRKQTEKH
jgi:hypothetical protein